MIGFVFVILVALAAFFPSPAYAIPSPDLIIGSLSSLSQIAMLAAATVGGLAVTGARPRLGGGTPTAQAGPWRRIVLWIALGVLALSLGGNLYQHLAAKDAELARFQATLVRPSHNPGEPILDPTLKEESYSEQLADPNGISTQELAVLMHKADQGQATDINFIDTRETGETQLGELRNFTAVRWPDLFASGIDFKNKRNVLVCHNGNRSSETCAALTAQGINCNFVIGGLEKWIAEGRSMSNAQLRSPDQLRGVPRYPNDDVFLSTADVHQLVDQNDALVLDARYPGEFAHSHVPGAINITIRRLPTADLKTRIAALPKRPVVLACYDRRSCFMSTVLGLELSNAGFDVRGRYTLPWEYYIPNPEPPYVKAWRDSVDTSAWTKVSRILAEGLVWVADRGIGLPAAIVLLALLSRLLVLPVSLKAERDQATLKTLSGEIAALKQRLGGDGKRFSRALSALNRRHGMTPGRNLLALVFLPVLALSVAAVTAAVHENPQALWWMSDLGSRDHTLLMPAIFSALVSFYIVLSVARTRTQRIVSFSLGFPAFTGLAFYLSAGADLYMVASACLMLVQRGMVAIDLARLRRALILRRARRGGVLRIAEAHLAQDCGNKAKRLGVILSHGLPAPDGLVLTPAFLARFKSASEAGREKLLDRLWRMSGKRPLAVRSSAAAEDGNERSFAGVFESLLNVDRGGLAAAIAAVEASFTTHTESYGAGGAGNVILQPMVPAEYAGVLFTEAPASFGLSMVEMVAGTAEAFVSGAVAPQTYLLGRYTDRLVGDTPPPVDLAPLMALGRRIEAIFGAAQDIEWAYCGGRFLILQSRDITRSQLANNSKTLSRERERARLLAHAAAVPGENVTFYQNELSELLPRPTPLSLDLMQSLWRAGGSVDLACRMLRLSHSVDDESRPYLLSIFGRLYVDRYEEHKRALKVGALAAMRLRRTGDAIERDYQEQFLPELMERVTLLEAIDFDALPTKALQTQLEAVRADYVTHTAAHVEVINITVQFYLEKAKAALEGRGLDPAHYLAGIPDTPMAQALAAAAEKRGKARIDAFLAGFGHRAPLDYELAQPRYREDRIQAAALVAGMEKAPAPLIPAAKLTPEAGWKDRDLAELVQRARRFQALKEEAKHQSLRQVALLRRILLALDRRFALAGGIFHLTFAEIIVVSEGEALEHMRAIIAERRDAASAFTGMPPLPSELDIATLETLPLSEAQTVSEAEGGLTGTPVSDGAPVTGRACVVSLAEAESGAPLRDFADGDIIVSRMMHPAWLPYFGRAKALVCEVGGWLSHVAILARECAVPMVIGVRGLDAIQHGEILQVHADGRIERLATAAADVEEIQPEPRRRSSIA